MTTLLLIIGGLWMVVAAVFGLALCKAAKRSMPAPVQETMEPSIIARPVRRQREATFVATAVQNHA